MGTNCETPTEQTGVTHRQMNGAVQNMCFALSHKSTTRVLLSSAVSAAVTGGSWQLVYPRSRKGVPYQPISLVIAAVDPVSRDTGAAQASDAYFHL